MNIEERLLSFRNLLYPNNQEAEELTEEQVKKIIYEGLREFLKLKKYQFTIGSYYFDITPKHLSVIYETPDTRIEVSNKDVHFETTRQTPLRYFVISDEEKDEYPEEQPCIQVTGEILQYDNYLNNETYTFTLMTDEKEQVKDYLKLLPGCELYEDDIEDNPFEVSISREINKKDKVTDVIEFFNTDKIRPVEYDYLNKKFVPNKFEGKDNYDIYLPSLDKKKRVISTIYSTIVDFYNDYINNK